MIEHQTTMHVRYGETDQMGYVHHSNHVLYLEEARMDLFSCYGLDVAALEREGILLPVVGMEIRYVMPLYFGNQLTVETTLNADDKFKLQLKYKILNQKLVAKATTSLVFVHKQSGKLIPGFHKYLEPLLSEEIKSSHIL